MMLSPSSSSSSPEQEGLHPEGQSGTCLWPSEASSQVTVGSSFRRAAGVRWMRVLNQTTSSGLLGPRLTTCTLRPPLQPQGRWAPSLRTCHGSPSLLEGAGLEFQIRWNLVRVLRNSCFCLCPVFTNTSLKVGRRAFRNMADVFDGKSEVYPLTVAGFLQQTQGWFLTNLLRTADCTGDIRTTP